MAFKTNCELFYDDALTISQKRLYSLSIGFRELYEAMENKESMCSGDVLSMVLFSHPCSSERCMNMGCAECVKDYVSLVSVIIEQSIADIVSEAGEL